LNNLPAEIVGMIASFLSPKEVFERLAMVDKYLFSCLCIERSIPWSQVSLTHDRDTLAIAKMVALSTLTQISCEFESMDERVSAFYFSKMNTLWHQLSVKSLSIQCPSTFFKHANYITPSIERLSVSPYSALFFRGEVDIMESGLKKFVFPSVKILNFAATNSDLRVHFRLGSDLFNLFPSVEHLKLINFENASETFWRTIPQWVKEQNKTLTLWGVDLNRIRITSWANTYCYSLSRSFILFEKLSFAENAIKFVQYENLHTVAQQNLFNFIQTRCPTATCVSLAGQSFHDADNIMAFLMYFREIEVLCIHVYRLPKRNDFAVIFGLLGNLKYLVCYYWKTNGTRYENGGLARLAANMLHRPMVQIKNRKNTWIQKNEIIIASPELAEKNYQTELPSNLNMGNAENFFF